MGGLILYLFCLSVHIPLLKAYIVAYYSWNISGNFVRSVPSLKGDRTSRGKSISAWPALQGNAPPMRFFWAWRVLLCWSRKLKQDSPCFDLLGLLNLILAVLTWSVQHRPVLFNLCVINNNNIYSIYRERERDSIWPNYHNSKYFLDEDFQWKALAVYMVLMILTSIHMWKNSANKDLCVAPPPHYHIAEQLSVGSLLFWASCVSPNDGGGHLHNMAHSNCHLEAQLWIFSF